MMENGSFHSPPRPASPSEEADARVKSIPLPNQLPKGLDFSEIPSNALRSSTLESLINQNEDLMARLSVALRKNNELEEKVHQLEREGQSVRARYESVKEQYLVLHEKDRMSAQRIPQLTEENLHYKNQIAKLEKGYTDIFVQAQAFQRRLQHLERYRARVKKAGRKMHAQVRELRSSQILIEEQKNQHRIATESFETKLREARDQVGLLRTKAEERDRLFNEKVQIENRLVFEQRHAESSREDAQERIEKMGQENASLRLQLKEVLVDRESKDQELQKLQQDLPNLRLAQTALTEQVESLQALWSHKQREFEQLGEKNKNLQKLNQNISVTLNQQRKELHTLTNDLEKERFTAQDKIKTLLQEIQMLRQRLLETGNL